MKHDDWIEQLQVRMNAHEESVPADLWTGIAGQLPRRGRLSMLMGTRLRQLAAAAVALLVVGAGTLVWLRNDGDEASMSPSIVQTQIQYPDVNTTFVQGEHMRFAGIKTPKSRERRHETALSPRQAAIPNLGNTLPQTTMTDTTTSPIPTTTSLLVANRDTAARNQRELPIVEGERHFASTRTSRSVERTHSRSRLPRVAVGLYAANRVSYSSRNNDLLDAAFDYGPATIYGNSPDYVPEVAHDTKHHAPLSLGLSVKVPLRGRFALTSGLVYTRLKSDFTWRRQFSEQTLHYIGIPLALNCNLWQWRQFGMYAVAGGQADVNVKATVRQSDQVSSWNMDKDRVQFSCLAGMGVQFNIGNGFGLYVEPAARYYFNNGSDVSNFFKEKPWNINLNTGLRITLE